MEEVEKANNAAVESCHRVISLLSQPQDQNQYRNLVGQTGEAVNSFKKVVSLLNSSCGHARVRKSKKIQTPFPEKLFLEAPVARADDHQPKPLQLLQTNPVTNNPVRDVGAHAKNGLTLGNPSMETNPLAKNPPQLAQQGPQSSNYHFLPPQQQHRYQLQQQQLKQQAELAYRRSNSGISLNFDSSTCTPTMSSTRSFISSVSIDGSVANLDGSSSFHLIGGARSADQGSYHKKRCSARGEDGSVKCSGSGRCHCSKKRWLPFPYVCMVLYLELFSIVSKLCIL